MRKLRTIWSERGYFNYPSIRIVHEWEDVLADRLGLAISSPGEIHNMYHRRFEKNGLVGLYHLFTPKMRLGLRFVMTASTVPLCHNNCNSIPVIIDFWLHDEDLQAFFEAYRHVPLMLVTSREVYEYLLEKDCPIPLEHWPLSYPDNLLMNKDAIERKKYDFCFFGRPNPFFLRLINQYSEAHPEFEYVLNQGSIDNRSYVTNRGRFICKDTGRQSYLDMIAASRISCYTTPGIDESKSETGRFNQVTPRVFEMLSNACHVIGHYPLNPDTEWYDLKSIVPNVDDYPQFEAQMNKFLVTPFDLSSAESFLRRHTTSSRAESLRGILAKHGIDL